ncbi:outer membrane protein assembly factor BamE [Rickettsiales bacterium LUAb2]
MPLLALTSCSGMFDRFGTNSFSGIYLFHDQLEQINLGMNKNDITKLIGTPTVTNTFDNNTWYYIYQKSNTFAVFKEKILEQNILVLNFDNNNILIAKNYKTVKDSKLPIYITDETHMKYKKSVIKPDVFNN